MKNFLILLKATLGQKVILGLTGLGLCLFILIHMLGNLLILAGSKDYNLYAHQLHQIKIFEILEIGLAALFLIHIATSLFLNFKNQRAKAIGYQKKSVSSKKTKLPLQFLVLQGAVLFVFLVSHLWTFKFGTYYETSIDGQVVRDIYRLVVEAFQQPFLVVGYVVTLFILALHAIHGLPASLKSLGFSHPLIDLLGWGFGLLVTIGFLVPLLYVHWFV